MMSTIITRRVLVGAAMVALLVGALISRNHKPADPAAARPTASATSAATMSWQDITGIGLPISSTAGPRCLSTTRAACFSETPDGAALAAAHLLVRTFAFVGRDTFTPTINQQVIGPDAPALARLTRKAYDQSAAAARVKNGGPLPADDGWLTGFHLDTYAPPGAQVQLLFARRDPDGQAFTAFTVHLEWRSDDWKLVAPMWGDWGSTAVNVAASDTAEFRSFDTLGAPA